MPKPKQYVTFWPPICLALQNLNEYSKSKKKWGEWYVMRVLTKNNCLEPFLYLARKLTGHIDLTFNCSENRQDQYAPQSIVIMMNSYSEKNVLVQKNCINHLI